MREALQLFTVYPTPPPGWPGWSHCAISASCWTAIPPAHVWAGNARRLLLAIALVNDRTGVPRRTDDRPRPAIAAEFLGIWSRA